jgi:predicted transcriptional regulator
MSTKAAFRLTAATDGLTKLLPVSEAEIMRIIWACGPLKVRAVHEAIAARRPIAYMTVMTTCVRMAEKGLLRRERAGQGYVYTATVGEREFVTRELAQVLDSIVRAYPSVLVHYLDTRRAHAAS